jgi:hypothetical protein
VVAWEASRLRSLLRLREYLCFLAEVGKNSFSPGNLIVLTRAQLDDALAAAERPNETALFE